jgi:uroporphyrinogen decarboxylase
VRFVEGEGPKLEALGGPTGLKTLACEIDLDRLAPIFETIAKVKRELPPSCAITGERD